MAFADEHIPITDTGEIIRFLAQVNDDLHSAGLYFKPDIPDEIGYTSYPDAEVPNACLIVMGSFDFTYYHQCEFVFHQLSSHNIPDTDQWPDHWVKPQLELLSSSDRMHALNTLRITDDPSLLVFAFNRGSHGDERYFIACHGISYRVGITFYYDRTKGDVLKDNERIAWWVSR